MTTRAEVLDRARRGWPMGKVRYSQNSLYGDYRPDCSGYVCRALGIAPDAQPGGWGGLNTVTLVTGGYLHEIDPNDLEPGDLIGRMGEGTAGNLGHVQIFVAWDNNNPDDNGHTVLEMTPTYGPNERRYSTWRDGYKAYRYRGVSPAAAPAPAPVPAGRPAPGPAVAFPLPSGWYFGPKAGPEESISCQYGETFGGRTARSWLQEWTNQLSRRGWDIGEDRQYLSQHGNDGYYGDEYAALALAFQADQGLTRDALIGRQTWDAAYHNPIT